MSQELLSYEELKKKYENLLTSYNHQIDKIIQLEMKISDLRCILKAFKKSFTNLVEYNIED